MATVSAREFNQDLAAAKRAAARVVSPWSTQ